MGLGLMIPVHVTRATETIYCSIATAVDANDADRQPVYYSAGALAGTGTAQVSGLTELGLW